MTHDNKLQVEAIKRGTVIDHIPAQVGFKLLTLFKLTETDQRITIGLNLPSGEMGRKDLIKIENTFLKTANGISSNVSSSWRPGKVKRVTSQASKVPNTRFTGTVINAIITVSQMACSMSGFARFSSTGINPLLKAWIKM